MTKNHRLLAAAVWAALWSPAAAPADAAETLLRYSPASRAFACDIPSSWRAFEEEEPSGFVSRLMGPDNPSATFRTGIDIRWVEKGLPGYVPYKEAIDTLRRDDRPTRRSATAVRAMRISGAMARTFEIHESRQLPLGRVPMMEEELHHYVALVPSGESYFVIRLSSTRDVYLDYRTFFVKFLKSFKTLDAR